MDPLSPKYPFYSPYHYASNSPILSIDLDGLESHKILNDIERIVNDIPELPGSEVRQFQQDYAAEKNRVIRTILNNEPEGILLQANLFNNLANESRSRGWSIAPTTLKHYISGTGEDLTIEGSDIYKYKTTQLALEFNNERFLTHEGGGDYENIGDFANTLGNGGAGVYTDYYDAVVFNNGISTGRWSSGSDNPSSSIEGFTTDLAFGLGDFTITSKSNLSIRRDGDIFYISGSISHQATDVYDWHTELGLSVDILGVKIYDSELTILKNPPVNAKGFNIKSTTWKTKIAEGSSFRKNEDGSFDYSNITFEYK